jgi:hypothetical protein
MWPHPFLFTQVAAFPAARPLRARRVVTTATLPAAGTAGLALLANVALLGTVRTKGFNADGLVDTLTLRKGVKSAAVDLNRALSTAALTVLGLAYLPGFEAQRVSLLKIAMVSVWVHATASFLLGNAAQFPNLFPPRPAQARQLVGLALGGMANGLIISTNFGVGPLAASPLLLCTLLLAAAAAHSLLMNAVALKTSAARPIGLVSIGLAAVAVAFTLTGRVSV